MQRPNKKIISIRKKISSRRKWLSSPIKRKKIDLERGGKGVEGEAAFCFGGSLQGSLEETPKKPRKWGGKLTFYGHKTADLEG